MDLMSFFMIVGYFFILYPIATLVVIFLLLIILALSVVFSVLGYYNYLKERKNNIILIKNVYVISILLGCFYFVSMLFKDIDFYLLNWLIIFILFICKISLVSFLTAILSFTIKTKKHLNCLFLVISTMLLAFVSPVVIFGFVLLDFVIRKLISKRDPEEIKKMFFY